MVAPCVICVLPPKAQCHHISSLLADCSRARPQTKVCLCHTAQLVPARKEVYSSQESLQIQPCSSHHIYALVVTLALGLVTLTPRALAFAMMSTRFRLETACAISAAYVRLCMRRSSTSRGLLTRNALWPEGIMCLVFLLEPKPI